MVESLKKICKIVNCVMKKYLNFTEIRLNLFEIFIEVKSKDIMRGR